MSGGRIGAALSGYALVTILQAVATFAAVGAFTRLLPAAAYGRYTLAMATALFLQAVLYFWLHAGMVRFFEKTRKDPAAFADHLATSWAALGVVSAAVAVLALVAHHWFGPPALAAGAYLVTRAALTLALEQHRMAGEVRRYAALETGQAAVGLVAGIGLALTLPQDGAAPLFGLALGNALALLADARLVRAALTGRVSWPHCRMLLQYGMPMGMAALMAVITQLFDRFLIAGFLDEAAAGIYAVAYATADRPMAMVFTWLGMAASPLILAAYERDGHDAAKAEVDRLARMILLLALPAAVGLAMVAEPLAEVLAGPEFRGPVVQLVPWIAAAALLNGLTAHYLAVPFILQRRSGLLALTMGGAALLNTGLNVVLIPSLGLWGAALSTVLAYGTVVLVRAILARPFMRMGLPLDDTLRCGAAAAAMACGLFWLPLPTGAAGLVPAILAGAVIYGAAAWLVDAAGCRRMLSGALGRR